jgi:DNA repair protein RadA/Sms
LPVVLAILSSLSGHALPAEMVAFGEVGLAGEVRGVTQVEKRIKECQKLGFDKLVTAQSKQKVSGTVSGVRFITELNQFVGSKNTTAK